MNPAIAEAVRAMRAGGVVAYPTEAVWGLGCDPLNENAVDRLFALKERPRHLGVLLIAARYEQVRDWIGAVPQPALDRALATWPGPHTWILPRSERVPVWISGGHAGIALRITAHPVAAALCEAWGGPLVSTSANRHSSPPARTSAMLRDAFSDSLDAIVEGELGGLERPTPIRDAISGDVVRH
jgi:L-threonylcarbamoyladenylate synthase